MQEIWFPIWNAKIPFSNYLLQPQSKYLISVKFLEEYSKNLQKLDFRVEEMSE